MKTTKLLMCMTTILRNKDLPSCINCIHFKEYPNHYPYDSLPDNTIHLSTCVKFGYKNMVTGCIEYDLAQKCRNDEHLCGKQAKHYQQKSDINLGHRLQEYIE